MRSPWPAAIAGVLIAVVPGCTIASLLGGKIPCDTDDACPPTTVCIDGRCVDDIGGGEGEGEGEAHSSCPCCQRSCCGDVVEHRADDDRRGARP